MAVISTGQTFSDGEQVTAAKLNNAVNGSTFNSGAVDNASTQLSGGSIIVKDTGITTAKIADANVTTAKISDSNVTTAKIADSNVTTPKLADANVTPAKLSTGAPVWDDSGANTGLMYLDGGNGANIELYGGSHATNPSQLIADASSHIFRSADGSTEYARIDNSGNLTIASGSETTPSQSQVDGTAILQTGRVDIHNTSAASLSLGRSSTLGNVATFYADGSLSGTISVSSGATAYNTSSDYRLKENVSSIENSVERLKQLKPCNFTWKVDGTRTDGFIAHEAQEVVPEAVHGAKDELNEDGTPKYQGIDQSKLIPLLTKALQEALVRIEALENA